MTQKTYPIELYAGDKVSWSCRRINDAEEENFYRNEIGMVDFDDLPEPSGDENAENDAN